MIPAILWRTPRDATSQPTRRTPSPYSFETVDTAIPRGERVVMLGGARPNAISRNVSSARTNASCSAAISRISRNSPLESIEDVGLLRFARTRRRVFRFTAFLIRSRSRAQPSRGSRGISTTSDANPRGQSRKGEYIGASTTTRLRGPTRAAFTRKFASVAPEVTRTRSRGTPWSFARFVRSAGIPAGSPQFISRFVGMDRPNSAIVNGVMSEYEMFTKPRPCSFS